VGLLEPLHRSPSFDGEKGSVARSATKNLTGDQEVRRTGGIRAG
jgi:hypothetical protein